MTSRFSPASSLAALALLLFAFTACDQRSNVSGSRGREASSEQDLQDARRGFQTRLTRKEVDGSPVPNPPPELFRSVKYKSPVGELAAYVSVAPKDGSKRPAIIWIAGGFDNGISDVFWLQSPSSNDQSARAFREAGVVTMFPSLRGGNTNPGFKEGFYGEVDDVLAASDFLAQQDGIDPDRIYLGGHSTGGTLAILVAACSNHFRAVFAFGPVTEASGYGAENVPFDVSNRREAELRAPARWLHAIRNPTFVLEGASGRSNVGELAVMSRLNKNAKVQFFAVPNGDHFSILAPVTKLVAQKIISDEGPTCSITFSERDFSATK